MPLFSDSLRNLASSLTIAALVIAGLVLGSEILIPLTVAVMISFVLSPLVRGLTNLKVPRVLAVFMAVSITIAVVAAFSSLVSTQLLSLTSDLGSYETNVLAKIRAITGSGTVGDGVIAKASKAVESLGTAIEGEFRQSDKAGAPAIDRSTPPAAPSSVEQRAPAGTSTNFVLDYLGIVAKPIAQTALTFLLSVFLLLQYRDLRDRVVRVVGTDHMSDTTSAMTEAGSRLSRLFLAQALLNGAFGLFVSISLWAVGVPNAAVWGALAAVMRFVPYVGSALAALPPLFLAAAVDPGWTMLIATAAIFIIGEPVMGQIAEPMVLGKKAGISPFAMVASASFWTIVWGPIGLILAAPLTMTLVVLGHYIKGLEFFSVLLGDEPALSPEQEFYHRLLSEDPISAVERFETALDSHSAGHVADSLVLPALQLAAYDQRLGRLEADQLARVSHTMQALEEAATQPVTFAVKDDAPLNPKLVFVVAARGPIDAAAANFISNLIKGSTSCAVTVAAQSSGLTALSSTKSIFTDKLPDEVLLVTVGGLDSRQLNFIAKRARRELPDTNIVVLDFRGVSDERSIKSNDYGDSVSVESRVSGLLSRLGHRSDSNNICPRPEKLTLPASEQSEAELVLWN